MSFPQPYFLLSVLQSIRLQSPHQVKIFQPPIHPKIIDTSEASCAQHPLIAISSSASVVPLVLPLTLRYNTDTTHTARSLSLSHTRAHTHTHTHAHTHTHTHTRTHTHTLLHVISPNHCDLNRNEHRINAPAQRIKVGWGFFWKEKWRPANKNGRDTGWMNLITFACCLTLRAIWSGSFASVTLINIALYWTQQLHLSLLKRLAGYSTVRREKEIDMWPGGPRFLLRY